jgi:leader peptidase (prepilin peptidase)/N-methyltransferase
MKDALFPEWTDVFGFIIGAFVGSFLNMVIYRLPRGLSFNEPKRSFCPKCKHPLDWIDLIPLLSWLSTKGRCRYCKAPIALRYELVETLNGLLFAGVWWRFMSGVAQPDLVSAAAYALIVSALVAIIFIDWELYIIPDELNAFLFIVALVYAGVTRHWVPALEGALLGWALIWGMALLGRLAFGKDAMGDGDIKMMRGVGALLGPLLLLANLGVAVVLGLIGGITGLVIAARQKRVEESQSASASEDPPPEPSPVWVVLLCGVWYLLCLDVVALFVKSLDRWVSSLLPKEALEEEQDDWKPSATTIPFGPYLAAGALACMLFGPQIEKQLIAYWDNATGRSPQVSMLERSLGRKPWKIWQPSADSKRERSNKEHTSNICNLTSGARFGTGGRIGMPEEHFESIGRLMSRESGV